MNLNSILRTGNLVMRALLLVVTVLLLSTGLSFAADGGEGAIQGKVVNGTVGSTSSVGDVEIALKTYVNNAEVSSTTATTDAEGNFQFSGLATDSSNTYQLTLTYQEADYTSIDIQFATGETSQTVDMAVYDATGEDTDIVVPVGYLLIDIGEGALDLWEGYHFNNRSDRTYVGSVLAANDQKITLRFSLPQGATELQLGGGLMSCCVVSSDAGFVDTMAVIPNQPRALSFGYKLKYTGSSYVFSYRAEYPTERFELWVQEREGVEVASDQLTPLAPSQGQDFSYLRFGGQDLARGDTIAITFSGLPYSAFQQSFKWLVLGVVAVALVGLGVGYPLLRKRRTSAKVVSSPRREREELLRQIARLDDDFEAGKIPEAEYRRLRGQRKARLGELQQGLGKRD